MPSRKRTQGKKRKAATTNREEETTQKAFALRNEDEADLAKSDLEWALQQHDETTSPLPRYDDNSLEGTVELSSKEVINRVGIELLLEDDASSSSSSSCGGKSCGKEHEDIAIVALGVLKDLSLTGKDLAQAAANLVTASEDELSKPKASFRRHLSKYLIFVIERFIAARNDPSKYNPYFLEDILNAERDLMGDAMKERLPSEHHHRINLSQLYCILIKLVNYMAYSPDGTLQEDLHCMPDNQCCVWNNVNSITRAVYWIIFGEKSTSTYEDVIKCVDKACTTAVKCDSLTDLQEQYEYDADLMGLLSRFEYYLVNVTAYINHHTLAIVANYNNDSTDELMTVFSSASASKELCGLGKERYGIVPEKGRNVVHTLHAQGLMMGIHKSKCYDTIRDLMSNNLLVAYAHALGALERIKDINCDILNWYGREHTDNDIDMKVLSQLAAGCVGRDPKSMSNISSQIASLNPDRLSPEERAVYDIQLELLGKNKLDDLLPRFRAGQYLQTLATKLPAEVVDLNFDTTSLSLSLQAEIEQVRVILKKKRRNQIIARLRHIKKRQLAFQESNDLSHLTAILTSKFDINNLTSLSVGIFKDEKDQAIFAKLSEKHGTELLKMLKEKRQLQQQQWDTWVENGTGLPGFHQKGMSKLTYGTGRPLQKNKSGKISLTDDGIVRHLFLNVPLKELEECHNNYLAAYCKNNNIAYGHARWPRIENLLTAAIADMQSYIQAESTDEELIQWTENPPTLEETPDVLADIPSEVGNEIIDFEEIPELDDVVRALDLATRRSLF